MFLRVVLFYCFLLVTANTQAQIADMVFKNAKIYTTNSSFQQAIAIQNGNIIYVGTNMGVNTHIGPATMVEDLGGKLMLPGIHDVHMHPLEASSDAIGSCALDNMETNPMNLVTALQNCNLTPNSNGWITAAGHSIFTFFDPNPVPNIYPFQMLDNVYPNTPAVVMEETSHSVWVNSAAMAALGITATTPDPPGGHIVKDATNGNIPTGIFLDNAGDTFLQAALASTATIDAQNKEGLEQYGLPTLAENGITSICEGRTYWKRNYHQIWQQIKNEGNLTCRVVLAPWIYPDDNDATLVPALQALYDAGDDMLRTHQLKVYSDGILINATSAMHAPYNYSWDLPFNTGLNYINETRLTSLITSLEQTGFDFHIHAIGDRGITESINAIEAARIANGDIGARHRITHLEIVRGADIARFAGLNITADMQVAGDFTNPAHWNENNFLVGAARTDSIVPIKAFHDAGARVTLSSDWDVSTVNPFVAMQNALTRAPQNMPNIEEVIKAYTINAAYVMRQENETGSLEVGKWADFIVVDRDVFTIPTTQISNTDVLMTYVSGEEVYRQTAVCGTDLNFSDTVNNGVYKGKKITVSNTMTGGGAVTFQAADCINVQPNTTLDSESLLHIVACANNLQEETTFVEKSINEKPVLGKLLYFEVKASDCETQLEWKTENSAANTTVVLQRSHNSKSFTTIATLKNEDTEMVFTDEAPLDKNYYRLIRQLSCGQQVISKTILAFKKCPKEIRTRLSQTQTKNFTYLQVKGGKKGKIKAVLETADGKQIKAFQFKHNGKESQSAVNCMFLPEGVYYLRVAAPRNRYKDRKTVFVVR